MAGWKVTNNNTDGKSIQTGDLGKSNGYHMYSYFPDSKSVSIAGSEERGDWRLAIGEHFGVTTNGEVFATAGKIGDMEIGDIASKNDVTVGRNLARKSVITAWNGTLSESEYHYTVTKSSSNAGLKIGEDVFLAGEKYVIQYKFAIIEGSNIKSIAGHCGSFTINKAILDGETLDSTDYNGGLKLKDTSVGASHSLVLYVMYNGNSSDNNFYIQPERGTEDENGENRSEIQKYMVWDLKVEKGEACTPWIVPFEDQLSPEATGNYSWQFSPSEGIKMWNGAQDGDPVFKVDKNGLYMNGNGVFSGTVYATDGEFTGKITATSGKISSFNIDGYRLLGDDVTDTVDGISRKSRRVGMAANSGQGCWAFWAGHQTGDGSETKAYGHDAPFRVGHDGSVVCQNIAANGGKIGPWFLKGTELYVVNNDGIYDFRLSVNENVLPKLHVRNSLYFPVGYCGATEADANHLKEQAVIANGEIQGVDIKTNGIVWRHIKKQNGRITIDTSKEASWSQIIDAANNVHFKGKKVRYGKFTMQTESQYLTRQQISTGLTNVEWAITTPDVSGDRTDCEMQGGIVAISGATITVSYYGQNAADKIYGVYWMAIGT